MSPSIVSENTRKPLKQVRGIEEDIAGMALVARESFEVSGDAGVGWDLLDAAQTDRAARTVRP